MLEYEKGTVFLTNSQNKVKNGTMKASVIIMCHSATTELSQGVPLVELVLSGCRDAGGGNWQLFFSVCDLTFKANLDQGSARLCVLTSSRRDDCFTLVLGEKKATAKLRVVFPLKMVMRCWVTLTQ